MKAGLETVAEEENGIYIGGVEKNKTVFGKI